MSKDSKPKSRWNKGNTRYDKATLDYIYGQYREADGWRHGARLDKSKQNVR